MSSVEVAVISDAIIDVHPRTAANEESFGGAGLNVAVNLARLGEKAHLVCPLASDTRGQRIREFLSDEGVRVWPLPTAQPTGVARTYQVGDSVDYEFSGAVINRNYSFKHLPDDALQKVGLIVVNSFPMESPEQVGALLTLVERSGAELGLDPNIRDSLIADRKSYTRGFERLASVASFIKVSREDMEKLYPGVESPVQRFHREDTVIVETNGPHGVIVHTDSATFGVPAAPLPGQIVNTVGAGDAFMATVVHELSVNRWPSTRAEWVRIVTTASRMAGAVCCEQQSHIP